MLEETTHIEFIRSLDGVNGISLGKVHEIIVNGLGSAKANVFFYSCRFFLVPEKEISFNELSATKVSILL